MWRSVHVANEAPPLSGLQEGTAGCVCASRGGASWYQWSFSRWSYLRRRVASVGRAHLREQKMEKESSSTASLFFKFVEVFFCLGNPTPTRARLHARKHDMSETLNHVCYTSTPVALSLFPPRPYCPSHGCLAPRQSLDMKLGFWGYLVGSSVLQVFAGGASTKDVSHFLAGTTFLQVG